MCVYAPRMCVAICCNTAVLFFNTEIYTAVGPLIVQKAGFVYLCFGLVMMSFKANVDTDKI